MLITTAQFLRMTFRLLSDTRMVCSGRIQGLGHIQHYSWGGLHQDSSRCTVRVSSLQRTICRPLTEFRWCCCCCCCWFALDQNSGTQQLDTLAASLAIRTGSLSKQWLLYDEPWFLPSFGSRRCIVTLPPFWWAWAVGQLCNTAQIPIISHPASDSLSSGCRR